MKLSDLIEGADSSLSVSGVVEDSRQVSPGDAFVAVPGVDHDGVDFISDAVARGASMVMVEGEYSVDVGVPVISVPNLAQRRGEIAAKFYGEPGRAVRCLGVTGTNGKTSVCHYTASVLNQLAEPCGYIGTIGWGTLENLQQSMMTTAGAVETQARLASIKDEGCRWAALEVSSHALAQKRVDAVPFEAAVFTNLSRDHLDYHGSMAEYGAAKRKLFQTSGLALGVVNIDDGFGEGLAADFSRRYEVITYGRRGDVRWEALRYEADGVRGAWQTPWGQYPFELPLVGEFSVSNAAAVLALLCGLGFKAERVVEAQRHLTGVPGRMEFIPLLSGPAAVVDYAHTPDALASVLPALRRHCRGDLICVVGCGGDRDPGKRPLMAAVAEEAADVLWLTSDNPRSEDPEAILSDMRAGLTGSGCVFECVDRAEAIERALSCAGRDDIVLIAGKGHEDYQELAQGRVPYSDRETIARIARQRAG